MWGACIVGSARDDTMDGRGSASIPPRQASARGAPERDAWTIAKREPTIPVLGKLSQAIGNLSSRLPLFDLWPFRYATSYEIKPGCAPLAPDNPKFQACYTPVGDFPDVAISPKLIYTRLITAFGAGVKGIL